MLKRSTALPYHMANLKAKRQSVLERSTALLYHMAHLQIGDDSAARGFDNSQRVQLPAQCLCVGYAVARGGHEWPAGGLVPAQGLVVADALG